MLYKRQKILLNLIHAAGGTLKATDLQKILFLYTGMCESEPSYHFVPYRFGCFSFQSYADRNTLIRKGYLYEADESEWKTTAMAKNTIDTTQQKEFAYFLTHSVPERGDALVRRVYREAPYYASRSEIVKRIFRGQADRIAVEKATPKPRGKGLFTIGYEGDSIDGYLDRMIRHGVTLLCDVRRNPLSRKTGFSKNQLADYCSKVGISYIHLPKLGIPGHRRRELNSLADYQTLFEEYRTQDLPRAHDSILQLGELLKKHKRIALTCFEKEHQCCHRHCVSEEMERLIPECPVPQHI